MNLFLFRLSLLLILSTGNHPAGVHRNTDSMAAEILKYVNEDRREHNLPALQMNSIESQLAEKHSRDMATGKVKFGHDGFNSRAKTIQKALGSMAIGENVASGSMTAREVVDGWLKSPGHKKNIEGNFKLTGIGYAHNKKGDIYFTQIFSR
jgi:uncharacterized protein YkwD